LSHYASAFFKSSSNLLESLMSLSSYSCCIFFFYCYFCSSNAFRSFSFSCSIRSFKLSSYLLCSCLSSFKAFYCFFCISCNCSMLRSFTSRKVSWNYFSFFLSFSSHSELLISLLAEVFRIRSYKSVIIISFCLYSCR
jgi:hypothetical protein